MKQARFLKSLTVPAFTAVTDVLLISGKTNDYTHNNCDQKLSTSAQTLMFTEKNKRAEETWRAAK